MDILRPWTTSWGSNCYKVGHVVTVLFDVIRPIILLKNGTTYKSELLYPKLA